MNNTRYYLGFNMVYGIGPARLDRLIERCGSIEAAWRAGLPDMIAAGLDAKICAALLKAQRTLDLDAELERAERAGIQLLTREDAGYPAALAQIPAPPPLIYVKGRLEEVDASKSDRQRPHYRHETLIGRRAARAQGASPSISFADRNRR